MKDLLILGAGTGGTMVANKLRKDLGPDWAITLVDRDDVHVYQPGLLFLPFGDYSVSDIVKPRRRFVPPGVDLVLGELDRVDLEAQAVSLVDGRRLTYDYMVLATGSRIVPGETEGLEGALGQGVADFYTLDGARKLAALLESFEGGRLLVHTAAMPIKCPVAPLEFAFLADAYLTRRGIRDKTELVYVTPLDGPFTKPKASAKLAEMFERRSILVEADFSVESYDGENKLLKGYDGRELPYDLAATIPVHSGSQALQDSGLTDETGWVPTQKFTLQSKACERVFVIGDATDLPASKAGSVAHFQAEVLVPNLLAAIEGKPLKPVFDGHANCFIETGFGKAILIDFNYETEPLPGKFPLPGLGPFDLLSESYVNHWGKLGFKWAYWNLLLKGEELPIDHRMLMAGKRSS